MKRKDQNSERNCNTELYFSIASLRDFVISRRLRTVRFVEHPGRGNARGGTCVIFFFFFSLKYSFFTALYGSLWFQSAFLKNFRVFSLVCTLLKTWRRKIAVIKSCSNRSVCVCARVSYSETMIVAASRFSHHGRIDDRFFFFSFFFFHS